MKMKFVLSSTLCFTLINRFMRQLLAALFIFSFPLSVRANSLLVKRCVSNGNFFNNDKCSLVYSGGSCSVAVEGSWVRIVAGRSSFEGEFTSQPVSGSNDVININFGGLVRGGLYRKNGNITKGEVYVNDDGSGVRYTLYRCVVTTLEPNA